MIDSSALAIAGPYVGLEAGQERIVVGMEFFAYCGRWPGIGQIPEGAGAEAFSGKDVTAPEMREAVAEVLSRLNSTG